MARRFSYRNDDHAERGYFEPRQRERQSTARLVSGLSVFGGLGIWAILLIASCHDTTEPGSNPQPPTFNHAVTANHEKSAPSTSDRPTAPQQGRIGLAIPFAEDFRRVDPGGIPPLWNSNETVGVLTDGTWSWLQCAGPATGEVSIPLVAVDGDFELTVDCHVEYQGQLTISLCGFVSSDDICFRCSHRNEFHADLSVGKSRSLESGNGGTMRGIGWKRFRIVRVGTVYRFLFGDSIIIERQLPTHIGFDELRLSLDNDCLVYNLALTWLPTSRGDRTAMPWSETFDSVAIGGLPSGWRSKGDVGVYKDGRGGFVRLRGRDGVQYEVPHVVFPDEFEVTANVCFDKSYTSSFMISIIGCGTSPDVHVRVECRPARQRISEYEAWFTGTNRVEARIETKEIDSIQLVRMGRIYRLSLNNKLLLARELSRHARFHGMLIGGYQEVPHAEVHELTVRDLGSARSFERGGDANP